MPTLNWIGKEAVIRHHQEVPTRLLDPVPALSCSTGGHDDGNLIVQGDNLHALKALLPRYAGQVKCIYIDPPYNTGNEGWVYNDNVNSPEIRRWLGEVVGKEGETLDRHDRWLCMMYPRLVLLKQFLREDGAIFVSIDDNEVACLRLLMDEVFGVSCFVASNVWQKRYSRENRGAIGDVHEYIVVYAKQPDLFQDVRNRLPIDAKQAAVYKNPNNDPRGRWRGIPMTAQGYRPNQMYEVETPSGKKVQPPEGRCWSTIEAEFLKLKAEGRVYFGKTGTSQPSIIRYLSEVEGFVPWTWWPHEEVGHTDEARKEVQSLFGTQTAFDTPKPTRLLQRVIQIATNPGDLILDSFAGSGTTGHAVLKQNAEDGGNRRFILVEMDEHIARNITAERVRRVAQGYTNAKGERVDGLGGGFQYCRLSAEPLFAPDGQVRGDVTFAQLAEFVWFSETGTGFTATTNSPLLGTHEGRAIYLLYNGILNDLAPDSGNVLTGPVYDALPPHDGPKIIYAAANRMGRRAQREDIIFKQTPYALEG
ncbi:MAG: site-specific DNA-methyltransferase [Castellaniella sp.]|uniref:site-specific DNA-methyltransferase n=1 Tax=Castellaniella sp. TaxID=1955812 RepID=UPI001201571A|nr:site-specific DNA-methyltransferase [Castellaniella sp.]TAN26313.1 MAG: site-specific DNA-methyltransferase [Castellaniella sp.]